ncbi:hypothetical protein Trydic_g2552 [Trypoxylus dichotomus]
MACVNQKEHNAHSSYIASQTRHLVTACDKTAYITFSSPNPVVLSRVRRSFSTQFDTGRTRTIPKIFPKAKAGNFHLLRYPEPRAVIGEAKDETSLRYIHFLPVSAVINEKFSAGIESESLVVSDRGRFVELRYPCSYATYIEKIGIGEHRFEEENYHGTFLASRNLTLISEIPARTRTFLKHNPPTLLSSLIFPPPSYPIALRSTFLHISWSLSKQFPKGEGEGWNYASSRTPSSGRLTKRLRPHEVASRDEFPPDSSDAYLHFRRLPFVYPA